LRLAEGLLRRISQPLARQELFPTKPRLRSVSPGWQINESTARPGGHAIARPPRWRTIGLMPMKVREVIRLLEKHGWVEMRSRGSHRHFKHPDEAFVITAPGSDGKELAPAR
jgi:predicted RNA binding protein YcfA (HicA-like mRNA interferase family)